MATTELPLGQLITSSQQRDAIHIAVAPVVAGERLSPGDHVALATNDKETVYLSPVSIGVVDPFLKTRVMPGERFWLFLYPQTITSLRHDWSHPAFEPAPSTAKEISEKWLRQFADECGVQYEWLLQSAESMVYSGDGRISGTDMPQVAFEKRAEAWQHYEVVTGQTVGAEARDQTMFSCAC